MKDCVVTMSCVNRHQGAEMGQYTDERRIPAVHTSGVALSYRRCLTCCGEGYIGAYYNFRTCPTCGGMGIVRAAAPTEQQEVGKTPRTLAI